MLRLQKEASNCSKRRTCLHQLPTLNWYIDNYDDENTKISTHFCHIFKKLRFRRFEGLQGCELHGNEQPLIEKNERHRWSYVWTMNEISNEKYLDRVNIAIMMFVMYKDHGWLLPGQPVEVRRYNYFDVSSNTFNWLTWNKYSEWSLS